jgi:hypothetical protein
LVSILSPNPDLWRARIVGLDTVAADRKGGFILYRPKRIGWLALGLVLLVAACGTANTDSQVELAEAAPSEMRGTLTIDGPVENSPTESAEPDTPTSRVEMTPTETEAAPAETPTVSAGTAPPEVELAPTKTPRVEVDVEAESNGPAHPKANPGPSEEQLRLLSSLESLGAAPELPVNEVWLNSEPRKLTDLRGKVVMVEFWTFG